MSWLTARREARRTRRIRQHFFETGKVPGSMERCRKHGLMECPRCLTLLQFLLTGTARTP